MLLSLCMPTNGVPEWVFPALNSIYNQNVDNDLFEVIVTDNGNNSEFEKEMRIYAKEHKNLTYKKTNAYMFDNQIEALNLGSGDFLKIVNHRGIFLPGNLQYMIDFIENYKNIKPVIYFSNGALNFKSDFKEYEVFDAFVSDLGVYVTWSGGVGIFKSKYEEIKNDFKYNIFFPHTGILFGDKTNTKYIINDKICMKEIDSNHSKKGKYNLYKAFALDGFSIIINLYNEGNITEDTLINVKKKFKDCIINFYIQFNIKKNPCSYDLNGFSKYINIFFSEKEIIKESKERNFEYEIAKLFYYTEEQNIKMKDKIVIFGAGNFGNRLCSLIPHENIRFIVDNNKEKSETFLQNIPVKYFDEIKEELKNVTVVIAVSQTYFQEIKNQLRDNGIKQVMTIDEYLKKIVQDNLNQSADYIKIYSRAVNWILNNSINENVGKSITHSTQLYVGYPEVTGYYIPSLINWGYKDLAIDYVKWLLDIQKENGSWYDANNKSPYVFDTAQIIRGLLAVRDIYPHVDEAIIKGCEWILTNACDNGRLTTPDITAWGDSSTCSELIHLYCLYPLKVAGKLYNRSDFIDVANRAKHYYIENYKENILNFKLLSHFYAYVMEALLELDEENLAKTAMQKMEAFITTEGNIPAYSNVNWTCSTGLFQLAMVWYRLGDLKHGDNVFSYACKLQNESGGWYGSYIDINYPSEEKTYFPKHEISWANKFFLDALYWRNKLHFNFEANNFLQNIDIIT